jgi:ABC-2 type transport system ATP-binding protein
MGDSEAVLRVEGLKKTYGDFTAVKDLSLSVQKGEVLGFLGPNGAGKTTSISMMCGLLKPTAGKVFLHGKPMNSSADDRLKVGLCPQSIVVWERLKCLEQLVFMGEMYGLDGSSAKQRGEKLLSDLGLSDKKNAAAHALSGGMKRRLNIALALVHDPEIVVFDEPEAGLDPQSRVLVRDFIKAQAETRAVILTTHNMDEADRVSDRVAVIDKGSVLVLDTPSKLKEDIAEGNIIEVEVGHDAPDEATRKKVLGTVEGLKASGKFMHNRLVVEGEKMAELVAPLLTALKDMELPVGSVVVRQPTLEDVFLKLTGRSLRE